MMNSQTQYNINDLCLIFNVEMSFVYQKRKNVVNKKLNGAKASHDKWLSLYNEAPADQKWFCLEFINSTQEEVDKLSKQVNWLNMMIRQEKAKEKAKRDNLPLPVFKQNINIELIKQIPIPRVLDIFGIQLERKYFKTRNERTPSAYYYENDNRWHDFGSGEGGDVIDLYCKLSNCSTSDALKYLQGLA